MLKELTEKLIAGENLSSAESRTATEQIMTGEIPPALIAAYLIALRIKGETAAEIVGAARAMRDNVHRVEHHQELLFDNCGTGGDCSGTFNISTTAAFVLAGCGLAIGKHGNRAVSSKSGSADLLRTLGAQLELSPQMMGRAIDEVGFGFLFAPLLHPAMKHVAPVRQAMGLRTIFNLLGPLTNPAGATHQMIGVFDPVYAEKVARAAPQLEIQKTCVVYCEKRVDELTTAGNNQVISATDGTINEFTIKPEELGFARCKLEQLQGGTPEQNAKITMNILQGEEGPPRDTVLLNAAVGLLAAEQVAELDEGLARARESIDSGQAVQKLKTFVEFTNRYANTK